MVMIDSSGSAYRACLRMLAPLLVLAAGIGRGEDHGTVSTAADEATLSAAAASVPGAAEMGSRQAGPRADQLADVLLAQFPYYDECPAPGDPGALRYAAGSIDLNDDGNPEVVALTLGREACGSGGCTAFVLRDSGVGYQVVTRITTVSAPILAAADRSEGWRDLIVVVVGGGAEPGARVLRYSGQSYPENASLAPPAGESVGATRVIAGDATVLAAAPPLAPPDCAETPSVAAVESLGGLRIGAAVAAVERLLGHPEDMGKPRLWEADGLYHREWTYLAAGVVIGLSAPKAGGPWEIDSITLKSSAKLTTARGIGIGASREEVLAVYGNAARSRELPEQGHHTLLVGSEYDALVFSFDLHDNVDRIFLGATAE
jgi:hypothetical protein